MFNLFCVFLFTGLWHGAQWTFVAWGLAHGALMMLEREGWEKLAERWFHPLLRIAATQLFFLLSLVLFRSASFSHSAHFFRIMFGFEPGGAAAPRLDCFLTRDVLLVLGVGMVLAYPVVPFLAKRIRAALDRMPGRARLFQPAFYALDYATLALILLGCSMQLAAGTHNPFLYFRF
jgi:alginate O-acetyltransferase complex protein AlgI